MAAKLLIKYTRCQVKSYSHTVPITGKYKVNMYKWTVTVRSYYAYARTAVDYDLPA